MGEMSILDWVVAGILGGVGVVVVLFLTTWIVIFLLGLWMWLKGDLPEVELPGGIDEFHHDDRELSALDPVATSTRHSSLPLRRYLDQCCDDEHSRRAGGEA